LEPVEAHIALLAGAALAGLVALGFYYPRGLAYPIATMATWPAVALIYRGVRLLRQRSRERSAGK
jgi:hypothetical protein